MKPASSASVPSFICQIHIHSEIKTEVLPAGADNSSAAAGAQPSGFYLMGPLPTV